MKEGKINTMIISKAQEEQARQQFQEDMKNVDDTDVEYASKKGQAKLDKLGDNPPGAIAKIWGDLKLMISLIIDYSKGNYTDAPWSTIAAATGAVIYFVSPIDIIPDVIPVIGYLDDAIVIKLALDFSGDDLKKYAAWKKHN